MTAYTTQHLPPSFVTIVIPIFGSVEVLQELVLRLEDALIDQCDRWEIILVEDGGPDENWIETARLATTVESVIGVRLSRNFGQQEAIAAGIAESTGDTIVVMDCDLQDPPECVGRLLDALREGADIAIGNRVVESAGPVRNIINHAYYWCLSRLSGYQIDPQQGTFSAIRRVVADSYLGMSDLDRPYRLVLDWLGFKVERIDFERMGRTSGASTYSLWRLMKFALSGVVFQSTRLLYASIVFGALTSGCAFLMGLYYIFNALRGKPPEGWASTIVVNLMLGGIILIAIGVMGVYVGKIFNQTRGRPMYIVRAKLGTRSSK
jgi:glycosyltransferase involved in cell wall biosynthesis